MYKLSNVLVHQYSGVKYLSMTKGASVNKVTDIGDVISDDEY